VAFPPQQDRLATGGQENHVALWTLRDDHEQLSLGPAGHDTKHHPGLVFFPDGDAVAVAAKDGVQIWILQTRQLQTRLSRDGEARDYVAMSRDGRYLAAARENPSVIEVWRKTADGYQHVWETKDRVCDRLAFSPRGDTLVAADWGRDEVAVYDAATGRVERRIPAKQTWGAEFSPDGEQLAFTEEDDVVVWDWAARKPLHRLRGHLSTVTWLTYSPDGRQLVSCGKDRRVILWDARTGQRLRTMIGHLVWPWQVVFAGSDRLVSLGCDGTVVLWHAGLGMQLLELHEDRANPCFHIAVSPDQRWLALRLNLGDIRLFDVTPESVSATPPPSVCR
jgi:WD40 repeat protein